MHLIIRTRTWICFIVLLLFTLSIFQLIGVFSQTSISNDYDQLTPLYLRPYQGNGENLQEIVSPSEFRNISCPVQKKLRSERLPPIALASFPGSGTTWLRYLIEESTGYLTGIETNQVRTFMLVIKSVNRVLLDFNIDFINYSIP